MSALVGDGESRTPLVLDKSGRLYLYRYWDYQERLVDCIQKGSSNLTVISGGPGTGKTTMVASLLADLVSERLDAGGDPPRILAVAPTGKAAARLGEAMREVKALQGTGGLDCSDAVREHIPDEAITVHRALGWSGSRAGRFVHSAENPMMLDVLVVDEASMIDLALMTRLLEAAPLDAKLVLLGDRDQLASVEAGSVLGDICNVGGGAHDQGDDAPAISRCIVQLTHNYRFGDDSGIGELARGINLGQPELVMEILGDDEFSDVTLLEPGGVRDLRGVLRDDDDFGILCAHRHGPMGVDETNRIAEAFLAEQRGLQVESEWYEGRPIMVEENDYHIGVFNGDVGVVVSTDDGPKVSFRRPGSEPKIVSPGRLPAHRTAYAITVHKSQGSQFENVVVVLPAKPSPVITRELLYTAVTRARQSVTIFGSSDVVRHAVLTPVRRSSGLRERLWGK